MTNEADYRVYIEVCRKLIRKQIADPLTLSTFIANEFGLKLEKVVVDMDVGNRRGS